MDSVVSFLAPGAVKFDIVLLIAVLVEARDNPCILDVMTDKVLAEAKFVARGFSSFTGGVRGGVRGALIDMPKLVTGVYVMPSAICMFGISHGFKAGKNASSSTAATSGSCS
jgi:hypothetical protein